MESQEFLRRALSLSLAIYRITDKFPPGEALAVQLRQLGNDIAGDLAEDNIVAIKEKINRLKIYFSIAKKQRWIKSVNWSILDFEYYKLQTEIFLSLGRGDRIENQSGGVEFSEPDIVSHNIEKRPKAIVSGSASLSQSRLNSRQSRISALLDRRGPLKMSALIPLFKNEISERTLRNELREMIKVGLIGKKGINKSTKYFSNFYRQFIGKGVADKK